MSLITKHETLLKEAQAAIKARTFYAAFAENPSPKVYGETADADGLHTFEAYLGQKYDHLHQEGNTAWGGDEVSPYTGKPLGISYPLFEVDALVSKAQDAGKVWRKVPAAERAAILVESLERLRTRFFEIAYATMHTTGQAFMMSFQASGPHAADRALEAIALGLEELERFPTSPILWDKPMGKFNIKLKKTWRAQPKGVAVVVGCSTFPTWNTMPGMYASLVTGNPAIIKPHPKAILPIAIIIAELQVVLAEHGLPTYICQLAADTVALPITKQLAENEAVKIIDYTGGSEFGSYLEGLRGKTVFTEKAGVNSIIIDSVDDVDAMIANLAFSVSLYSGQMCTAPQNFFVPAAGIDTKAGPITFDALVAKFTAAVSGLANNSKAGQHVLGAIQNPATLDRAKDADKVGGKVALASCGIGNDAFPNAMTATTAVLTMDAEDIAHFSKELFGPIAIFIKTEGTHQSVALAKDLATKFGAISCGAYTTNQDVIDFIKDEMAEAATPVSFNLTGGIYVNQNAGFSDFHVSGGNPAGNASLTNPEFIVKRFTWVGFREPAVEEVA